MVDAGIDDQRRQIRLAAVPGQHQQCVTELAVAQLDAVLSLGREPAPVEALRGDGQLAALGRGPGQPADDARRDQHHDGNSQQQEDETFFHGEVPETVSTDGMLACSNGDSGLEIVAGCHYHSGLDSTAPPDLQRKALIHK